MVSADTTKVNLNDTTPISETCDDFGVVLEEQKL